jgi:hypothetical protein
MRRRLIHTLAVASVAQIAKIAKGMRLVPSGSIAVDRVLSLHFVAILAR